MAADGRDDRGSELTAATESTGFSEDQLRAITSVVRRLLHEELSAGHRPPREESRGEDSSRSGESGANSDYK